jgi:four helix bundle protein
MQDFKNLKVWKKSHALTLDIYRSTVSFPAEEKYGLVAQIRKAAVSVESNLAEGTARSGDSEFRRFAYMALGSACEIECQLILARDLGQLQVHAFERLNSACHEVRKMLWALIGRLTDALGQGARSSG